MIKRVGGHIETEPPKKPKKVTGTRFASVLGANRWSTPFEAWCAITRTYEEPFEDTVYTKAGRTIEPLQIDFMRKHYAMDVVTPTDEYGENYFERTWGDFYPNEPVFGGMWDALMVEDGLPTAVLEMKTTKRAEDWMDGAPEYYALQGALYAYLLNLRTVIMVCSFLAPEDYDHPEEYVCSVDNTITDEFDIYERFPNFDDLIASVEDWWEEHVKTGISPDYDEKRDKDILKALSTNIIEGDKALSLLLEEADSLMTEIDEKTGVQQKRLAVLKDAIKDEMKERLREGDTEVNASTDKRVWSLSRGTTTSIDKKALEKDGLLEKYTVTSERLTLKNTEVKHG